MAFRFARIAVVGWLMVASASNAFADPFGWVWNGTKKIASDVARDTKRRNCWPEPFVQPDRQAVRAPFNTMVAHGWRQQNLIAHYHFHEDGSGLTDAGQHKIRWILFEAASQHRVIYVQMADDPEATASRLAEVHQWVAQLSPHGALPLITETHIQPRGWPAEWVDAVGRKFQDATPAPTLPASSSPTTF